MFLDDLFEAVRPDYLYHSTDSYSADDILSSNEMLPKTQHLARRNLAARPKDIKHDQINGVSLTRSYAFARNWRGGYVVFILDARRLRHDHRVIQVDYYGDRSEREEFVVGGIKNFDRYLVSVIIRPEEYEEL